MSSANSLAEIRARQALRSAGLPYDGPLERASSTRNDVYLSDDHVVRVNQVVDGRLEREATVYRLLADEPWVPDVVAASSDQAGDYLIVSRKPGRPLSRCWPDLPAGLRHRAVRQLAGCLATLHDLADDGSLAPMRATPHLLGDLDPVGPLLEGLERLAEMPHVDHGLIDEARFQVLDAATALDRGPHHSLIHGDLTFENILWDGHHITALVDFEWTRPGPADLDLDVLGRYLAIPGAHLPLEAAGDQDAADYRHVPGWLAQHHPAAFEHRRLPERLLVYALAFEVRDTLETELPADKSRLDPLHPWFRLSGLVSTGGHVSRMLDQLGVPAS